MTKNKFKKLIKKPVKGLYLAIEKAMVKQQKKSKGFTKKELRKMEKEIDKLLSI